jgi:SsrA-binding protein
MVKSPGTLNRKLAVNRVALRDYFVLERFEAGIELRGTEVKSVKSAHVNLGGSFARIHNGEVFLFNLNIAPYDHGNQFNHQPDRQRRLLLHSKEIRKLGIQADQKGLSLIPLSVYLKKGMVKVEIGVCKGKRMHDKRNDIRRKTAERETARAIALRH